MSETVESLTIGGEKAELKEQEKEASKKAKSTTVADMTLPRPLSQALITLFLFLGKGKKLNFVS